MKIYRSEFQAMGGANEILVQATDETVARRAMEVAAAEVARIERKYSRYRKSDESIVTQINERAGTVEFTACDEETNALLDIAAKAHVLSSGKFDITSGVLRNVWNFKAGVVPDDIALAQQLSLIGWEKVERGPNGVRLSAAGMEIDFGGFGKEYAADRAGEKLLQNGIASGLVNLGGDIKAVGPQVDGQPWPVGVANPRQAQAIVAKIPISKGGLATSGDNERYFEKNGRRYCHIINAKTGWPVNCWSSVSVCGATTLQAGIYSTIAMLKEKNAETFLRKSKLPFLMFSQDGTSISNAIKNQERECQ